MKFRILLFAAFVLILSNSANARKYSFEKAPGWVKSSEIPVKSVKSKYDIMSGYYFTLVDFQVNLEENATYSRQVMNIVSYSGITSASQLSVVYDTSYQQLTIHHLYVWRKGVKIDRTSSLSLETLNNEMNLQQGIYTGLVTAYDILDDIRKDDMIDFSYTLTGTNPILGNEKHVFFPIESINPVDLYSIRILYPNTKDYAYECIGCDSLMTVSDTGNYRQMEIKVENVPAFQLEDRMPSWRSPAKYFILSSFKSWKDVNNWAQKVFALQQEPDLSEVYSEIFTGSETTEQKINKIISFVQDDIRYMGIEAGIGSIKPFPPGDVVKKRFGDCKDKSLLLVWLLKKIGVDKAYPVLVNTNMQHELGRLLPSNEVFNHCIVTFEYDSNRYWVDPTMPMQGGDFRDLYTTDFGKVLIIGMPADSLQEMAPQNKEPKTEVIDELMISSFTAPATLELTSKRYGFEADNRRGMFEFLSSELVSEQVVKDLKLIFPVVNKTSDLKITDDPDSNTFIIKYSYEIDGFWQDGDKSTNNDRRGLWIFRFEPVMLYSDLNVSACVERKSDYPLDYPLNLDYQIIFHFPSDLLIMDDYKKYDNKAFSYEEKVEQINSNTVKLRYLLKTKSKFIKAEDYPEVCRQKNEIAEKLPVVFYFPK